jgi:hypothetical protein
MRAMKFIRKSLVLFRDTQSGIYKYVIFGYRKRIERMASHFFMFWSEAGKAKLSDLHFSIHDDRIYQRYTQR